MTEEYVTYKAPNTLNIEKSLEVMRWILDPDSRPYDKGDARLITRSASLENQKAEQSFLNIQKMLELQRKVLDNL